MLLKVIRREIFHGGSGANGAIVRNRVIPVQGIRQDNPRSLPRFVEGEQRAVLANGLSS